MIQVVNSIDMTGSPQKTYQRLENSEKAMKQLDSDIESLVNGLKHLKADRPYGIGYLGPNTLNTELESLLAE